MRLLGYVTLLLAAAGSASGAVGEGPVVKQDHVKVWLVSDVNGIRPGGSASIAVQFEIEKEWHIYWLDHGVSAGLPTVIEFRAPTGWEVTPLRFPAPIGHAEEFDEKSYVLEGSPAVLTEIRAPANAKPGTMVKLEADVSWLVCRKECVKGDAKPTLELPIVAADAKVESVNADRFKKARRAQPIAATEAKYVKVRVEAGKGTIKPGDKFEIRVLLEVEKGFHIQSAKPTVEGLIGTELFLAAPSEIVLESPKYPTGKERNVPGLGTVSELSGTVTIVVDAEAEKDIAKAAATLTGVVRYQACDDKGVCFPPVAVEFEEPLKIEGAAAARKTGTGNWGQNRGVASDSGGDSGGNGATGGTWLDRAQGWFTGFGVIGYLAMAFVGGFILNFMPCVLPVISIKVLSFVRQAHEHRFRVFMLGLAFSAGIVASFAVLGIVIRQFGGQWGGLFQNPRVVIGLAAVVTAFALSLFGVFSLNPPHVVNELGEKVQGEGLASAFGTGLLATALGTACTAPFISAVVALALKQTPNVALAIFLCAGLGMALPYLVLTAIPGWVRFVPRPGAWMMTFERIVGFVLLATVVWLLNPLATQIGANGLLWTLVFLLFVSAAAWVYGQLEFGEVLARRVRTYATVGVLIIGGWWICFRWVAPIGELEAGQRALRKGGGALAFSWTNANEIPWQPYSWEAAESAKKAGKTLFIDYTAEWCVNCKANERLFLNTDDVRRVMRELGVVPFKADYTSPDPEIAEDLKRNGRSGVPMYLVVSARDPAKSVVLPEVLTKQVVIDALRAAGPSAGVTPAAAGGPGKTSGTSAGGSMARSSSGDGVPRSR